MKKYLWASVLLLTMTASWATTKDDVNFAQRQCQQRDALEHDAAVKAKQPMAGANYTDIETNVYYGDGKGAYRWNSGRKQYCYHNSNGSVQRCVN